MNILSNIDNTFDNYQYLISFYERNKYELFSKIDIEINQFFAANMSAVLGAILDKFTANFNDIDFIRLSPDIEKILLKNDFLTYYGRSRAVDVNNTTIKYQKLKPTDGKYFKAYVIEELIDGHTADLPNMSPGVKDKIVEAIYEIFVNAQMHSRTDFIYTCGQFFPNLNKIEFTIVDTGIGFKEKINQRFNSNLNAVQAIKWAVQDGKTTKEDITGGIGLAVLREFVVMNKGKMQIISNEGFYECNYTGENTRTFKGEFPGTIVTLQFRTDDKTNYLLKSEINENNIL